MSRRECTDIERWKHEWLNRSGQERVVRVRWLLNPDSEPLRNVQVTEQDGTIADIRSLADDNTQNVLPVALIPPLVNAHTHLEFSALTQPLHPPQPFQSWIRSVMKWRQTTATELSESIRLGRQELRNCGVQLTGEITTGEFDEPGGDDAGTLVAFREAIGLRPGQIQEQLHKAENHLKMNSMPGVVRGLSPHAPYTVHSDLLQELVSLAAKYHAPVAMHLAETTDELELLSRGRGPFAEFLTSLGLFDQATFSGHQSVLEFLQQLAMAPKALAIHGNFFVDQDIAFLAQHPNITTVYCPRTHLFFGHPTHPFRRMLAAGVRVILGTDSRASNPDLNIWRELQHAARLAPELSVGQLLAMITTHAAEALGMDSSLFRITSGGTFNPVLLTFDESLSDVEDIVRHQSTTLQGP